MHLTGIRSIRNRLPLPQPSPRTCAGWCNMQSRPMSIEKITTWVRLNLKTAMISMMYVILSLETTKLVVFSRSIKISKQLRRQCHLHRLPSIEVLSFRLILLFGKWKQPDRLRNCVKARKGVRLCKTCSRHFSIYFNETFKNTHYFILLMDIVLHQLIESVVKTS